MTIKNERKNPQAGDFNRQKNRGRFPGQEKPRLHPYYWREFATRLPKEEAANAARMMNMQPHLLKDQTTFEVAVDNDMVQKYMSQLAPQIEMHLRQQLHNRKIKMTVRVSAANENLRAYSHVERFQMMSKKNPSLLKLKEAFGLELS